MLRRAVAALLAMGTLGRKPSLVRAAEEVLQVLRKVVASTPLLRAWTMYRP